MTHVQPNAVHHIAVMATDIKKHIEYFSDVLGCPLVAIFDMHGVPGALHAFLKLNDHCHFSIVQMPDLPPRELGVTHAGSGAGRSAAGTMQHLAFNVDSEEEMLALRDRIRSRGIPVLGPMDHGMCKSMYFAGPDNLALEVATSDTGINPNLWIDPAVTAKCGMSAEEVSRYKAPVAYDGPAGLRQPAYDETKPQLAYPKERLMMMLAATDEETAARAAAYNKPPVAV